MSDTPVPYICDHCEQIVREQNHFCIEGMFWRDREIVRLTAELATCRQECKGLQEKLTEMEDEWYSPAHMDAVNERTIHPLRERAESAEAQVTELQAKYAVAVNDLKQLRNSAYTKSGITLAAYIDAYIAKTPQSILNQADAEIKRQKQGQNL